MFLSYEQLNPKLRVFFTVSLVAMVTDYIKIINKTYLAIIHLSNDTILLSLSVTEWFNNCIKRQDLQTVEMLGSNLKLIESLRRSQI